MSREPQDRAVYRWAPAGLGAAALVALLGALVVRGEVSLAFLSLFVVLLPAALAASLLRWSRWPQPDERRQHEGRVDWRRVLVLCGVGLLIAALVTLVLGVAWSGGRLGNVLLVAGVLLMPPAAIVAALGWLLGRAHRLAEGLRPGERLEIEAREHWGVFLPATGVLGLALLLALGPFGVIGYSAAGVLYLLLLPATAVRALGAFLNTGLALTPDHVLVARGVFRRRVERLTRTDVMACGVNAGWTGRLLGFGTLNLICDSGRSFSVRGIADPDTFCERLGVLELHED